MLALWATSKFYRGYCPEVCNELRE